MQRDGYGVDDALFSGSPGVGTDDVKDLRVPAGHSSYRIEANNDWWPTWAASAATPASWTGMTGLSAKAPSTARESRVTDSYFTTGSTSQNMSTVVAGVPDRAVKDDGRGIGDMISGIIS